MSQSDANNPTAEEIQTYYQNLTPSIDIVNGVIAGTMYADEDAEYRQDVVDRNTRHLEVMLAKDFWTTEDMTAAQAAITAGNAYTAS